MNKSDFPYFTNNKTVYLDNAATTQKPQRVIDSILDYYTKYCSNTHRGSYSDGNIATTQYEKSRGRVKKFINASSTKEIIFTKGATEGINMVASSYVGRKYGTVIASSLEHHSNIVPWHIQGRKPGDGLEVIKYKDNLELDLDHFEDLLKKNKNSFISITHVSNAFGVVHPVKEIIEIAHNNGSKVLIDGAQSIPRFKVDVNDLKADFYTFSGHKCYGPTGIGVLYINKNSLPDFNPYQTGGATISKVDYTTSKLLDPPFSFEAGTQNIAGVIGLKSALEYMEDVGLSNIEDIETSLTQKIYSGLKKVEGINLYTVPKTSIGNISFNINGLNPNDIGTLLDKQKIAVRWGHHCAMPIMKSLGVEGTIRLSLALYNDEDDIDKFFDALDRTLEILRK